MHCRQFFWLERKLNLGANLCIKVTWLIGFGPWQLIWDLKDLNNSCIFCFICSTFQKKVMKNKNRAGTAVQQVFTYVSSILIFSPTEICRREWYFSNKIMMKDFLCGQCQLLFFLQYFMDLDFLLVWCSEGFLSSWGFPVWESANDIAGDDFHFTSLVCAWEGTRPLW